MELKSYTRTRNSFSSSSSDRETSSVSTPSSQNHHFTRSTLSTTLISVVELQTKYFPIQPRPGPKTEIRDVMSSSESSLSPTTLPHPGKLKEPRDLYSTTTLLHPLKWPVECQVIPEKIRHIESNPQKSPKLEPFNILTGKEPQPQPVGVEMGTTVYDYQPKLSVDYFCRATVGGRQDLDEYPISPRNSGGQSVGGDGAPQQQDLKFESRFESGNLAKAIKVTNTYYELHIRPDLYTDRHAQWFYFRIQNTRDNQVYRFSIVNFNKPDSLYRYGLKVLMYSEKDALLNGIGWVRAGQNITYFKNDVSADENGPYYTLTFNLKFGHNNDTVYLAQCYPYTYSTLQTYLKSIEDDEYKSQLLTIRLLCRSLAGNNVHVLTVTSPNTTSSSSSSPPIHSPSDSGHGSHNSSTESEPSSQENNPQTQNKKPVIVISARVHPGETQSSYMMKGIIDFLTSSSAQAKTLRDRFIFKLIPMLNPDGVIVGNSRCCLLGQDLNRQYRTVLREAFPQIYHAKVMLRRLQEENGIFLYCDLHGHSRKNNVFIYGCENRRVPEKKLVEQVFPLMMHKNAADKFSFQNCKFKIQKNKEGTGRIFVWTLGVVNSYTLEISLGGSTMPSRQFTHFSTADYEACGRHFCETLLDYSDSSPAKESLRDRILQKLIDEGSTADEPKNVQLSDYSSLSNSETEGEGDDDEDDDEINQSINPNDPSSSSNKLTPGILQVTNINNRSSKNQLKRQLSIRKHSQPSTRPIKNAAFARKSNLISGDPITPSAGRSPLPIHRASVDFTKMATKQRKLEEALSLLAPPPPPSDNDISDDMENDRKNVLKDFSPSYRRLSKFRRKTKKSPTVSLETNSALSQQFQQAKCTTILFDDPFKPPTGTPRRHHHSNKRASQYQITNIPPNHSNSHHMDWLSGTEDECDPYDSKPVTFLAPSIKITDYGGGSAEDNVDQVLDDLQHLKLSEDCQVQTVDQPQYTPFTPSFPVGKAFLHQTCYPKGGSAVTGKLSTSHSDTKLSEQSSSRSPQPQRASVPLSRRSSISYLGGGRLQATGSTIFGGASSQGDLSGRRRVSWTGTLTVSVPTVPIPVGGASMPRSPQRKKSFRKSKSLNDTNEMDGNTASVTSVVRCGGGGGVLVTRSSSSSSSSKWMGGVGVRVGGLKYFGMNASSSIGGMGAVHTQQQSKVGKKRGKLKRSKHK